MWTSFEVYGSGPPKRSGAERMIVANIAAAKKSNFILTGRFVVAESKCFPLLRLVIRYLIITRALHEPVSRQIIYI